MRWIVGLTEREALDLDATILANARNRLRTAAAAWGAFKHPDRDEWCVPWDDDRAAIAQLLPNQDSVIPAKVAERRVKRPENMRAEQWEKPPSARPGLR